MGTECYAMVRGSSLRVTGLDRRGAVEDEASYAVSKSVATVRINEVIESSSDERLKSPDGERRLRLVRSGQTIRYRVDIDFLRVDPGVFSLVAGVPLVRRGFSTDGGGFGEGDFGEMEFGEGEAGDPSGDVIGFDTVSTQATTGFALEVWSKLAGQACASTSDGGGFGEGGFGEMEFGEGGDASGIRQWGYTLFPYLRGGRLGGFAFQNGLVSFSLIGAQTRKAPRWGVGAYDLSGYHERLTSPVSRNSTWRTFITPALPPAEFNGTRTLIPDVISNGTPDNPMPDPDAPLVVSGGGVETSAYIISGGRP